MAQTRAERRVLDKVLGISAHDSDEPAVVDARRSAPRPLRRVGVCPRRR